MKKEEIKEAAYSASKLNGADRINFVYESYPNAKDDWGEIFKLARMLNKGEIDICKYYGSGKIFK